VHAAGLLSQSTSNLPDLGLKKGSA
jgi:hypothetical protein